MANFDGVLRDRISGPVESINAVSEDRTIPTGTTLTHPYIEILLGTTVIVETGANLITKAPTISGTLTIDPGGNWDVI